MEKPKISVIIPVYSAEETLNRCLDSVLCQTLPEIEIICIDDASTDGSCEILHNYASADKRIKLIEFTENKGAAVARNSAINISKGEYLGFVDSDDYIDKDFYLDLYMNSDSGKAEIVKGPNFEVVSLIGHKAIDVVNDRIRQFRTLFAQYQTAIFKRDFIIYNKLEFPCGFQVSEDAIFAKKAAILADKINIFDTGGRYHYARRADSLNSTYYSEKKYRTISPTFLQFWSSSMNIVQKLPAATTSHFLCSSLRRHTLYRYREMLILR
ncbi:MAG: glycosyltransferase [Desulfovibrio sp.]|jgi:glycosyltransferase involved in cell wall biosynthesis|nr:glycosyltransferase [Desulfovibrio sp.]